MCKVQKQESVLKPGQPQSFPFSEKPMPAKPPVNAPLVLTAVPTPDVTPADSAAVLRAVQKELRDHKKALTSLTTSVVHFLALLDGVMKGPGTPERGRRLGKLASDLALANDFARHFALNLSWETMNNATAKARRLAQRASQTDSP